jgi:hypothetical protein
VFSLNLGQMTLDERNHRKSKSSLIYYPKWMFLKLKKNMMEMLYSFVPIGRILPETTRNKINTLFF